MDKDGWKALAIFFLFLLILETAFVGWAMFIAYEEEKKEKTCFYEVCGGLPEAYYIDGVCTCYDYDVFGNLIEVEETYIK